jgi:1-acyl-sn-glycerol-3-phosphate acyltransferase
MGTRSEPLSVTATVMPANKKISLSYRCLRAVLYLLCRLLMRVDAQGLDKTPLTDPLLVVFNHMSVFEAPLVVALLPRHPVAAIVKKEYAGTWVGRFMNVLDPVYVARGEVDRAAMREILQRLKEGAAFAMTPEGTRSSANQLMEARRGVAYFALKSGAQVLPIAVWGQERATAEWKRLRRPRIYLRTGDPFVLVADPAKSRQENLSAGTGQIMQRIAALLPAPYHGAYSLAAREGVLPSTGPGEHAEP